MRQLNIAFKLLWRELKNGELNLLALALVIAVTSMSSVALITSRVSSALLQQAGDLIAADLLVTSAELPPDNWQQQAESLQIQTSQTVQFPSIVLHGENTQLASIKAVAQGYPLRGELRTDLIPYSEGQVAHSIPASGEVWVDSRLFNALQISLGNKIELGSSQFTVSRIISFEPDFGGDLFSVAPRLLLNISDLQKTGLITAGSRVRYKSLFAGDPEKITQFKKWLNEQLRPSDSIQGIRDARPELKTALDRADRFLGLSSLVAVMLSAIAIALTSSRFARRHQHTSAIMRSFGARQNSILMIFSSQLALLAMLACTTGVLLGYLIHELVIDWFSQFVLQALPAADLSAALPAFTGGLLLLFGFAMPALIRLKQVSPLQVMQTAIPWQATKQARLYLPAILLICLLVIWQARDLNLAMVYLAGLFATVVILGISTMALLWFANQFKSKLGVSWRLGLTYLTRRRLNTMIESIGFGIGMMVIIILILIRTDMIDDWLISLPQDTPNQFVINIQPHQLQQIKTLFKQASRPEPVFFPMVRGRLTEINGIPVKAENYDNPRTQRLATRLFNLSWSNELPAENTVSQGQWWPSNTTDKQFSFDSGLAEQLGIKLGDTISYYISGETISAPVTSLREINWDSFKPNFFVISPASTLEQQPATYISSFYLASTDKDFLTRLVREFPNLTVIDVELMINQVRGIMQKVIIVIEAVFVFTLVAGLLVMVATMQSTHDERIRDNAIMKTLGASKSQLRKILFTEFFLIGLISSLIATLAANLTGFGIATGLMNMSYQVHLSTLAGSLIAGTTAITFSGLIAFWRYHKMSPVKSLQNS